MAVLTHQPMLQIAAALWAEVDNLIVADIFGFSASQLQMFLAFAVWDEIIVRPAAVTFFDGHCYTSIFAPQLEQ